jgi:RNA polymerase sigma factor (sigma-70 family)
MTNTPPSGWTDEILLREIRAGGQRRNSAWEYIYKAWRSYYLSPVLRMGGTPDEVDDVMGQVVMDVEKQILKPDFQLQTTTLRVYFTEALKRACARSWSKTPRTVELDPQLHHAGQGESVEQAYIRQEQINRLDALLNKLGEPCKTVLMRFARGYSMREIATELGFENEQSAKNAKLRCHRKLLELTDNL